MNNIDRYIKIGARVFAIGGWLLSIVFSAQGFGFEGGAMYILAGYFLALLVTLFEVVLNRFGSQLPKTLALICFMAYVFGIVTNFVGIYIGRGSGGHITDYAIAIVLGLILELYPEPLLLFSLGMKSSDLLETLTSLFSRRKRQPQYPSNPEYSPPNSNVRGRVARQNEGRR